MSLELKAEMPGERRISPKWNRWAKTRIFAISWEPVTKNEQRRRLCGLHTFRKDASRSIAKCDLTSQDAGETCSEFVTNLAWLNFLRKI